jgi:hypothetical protein
VHYAFHAKVHREVCQDFGRVVKKVGHFGRAPDFGDFDKLAEVVTELFLSQFDRIAAE